MVDIWQTGADRCGQVRTGADNSVCWLSFLGRIFCGQVRTGADRGGQVRKSLAPRCPELADIGRTGADSCGQVRTGADSCGKVWFPGVSHSWRTFGGQVRTGADNSGSWLSSLVDGHLADRCRQVGTGGDRCRQVWFLRCLP